MSHSQQQSLDEEAVFLPVTESCPGFLHCEGERLAVERLMSAGPAAFYACLGAEKLGSFLSQEEVNQISGWVQDYAASPLQVVVVPAAAEEEEEGEGEEGEGEEGNDKDGGGSVVRCLLSGYFPTHSDSPAPFLDLGWPERSVWLGRDCVEVFTSPPEEGQPSIREIVRRHLQQASQVIAIVTDRLTDNAVIGDLHSAASRGVPVYIILDQRAMQEDNTPSKLRHPHMQVRVLGGKTFCSREGRMVVGQMKDNYILVDLETVIHGSYSLTWTDAHLHRQLVTLLSGPVVGSFDREFRILFAASFPVPEERAAPQTAGDSTHYRLNDLSDLWYPNRPPLEPLLSPPPPPPMDNPLDWEALGVFRRSSPNNPPDEATALERPTQDDAGPLQKQPPAADEFPQDVNKRLDKRGKQRDKTTPGVNNVRDIQSSSNTRLSMTDSINSATAEIQQRIGPKIERPFNRHLYKTSTNDVDDRTMLKRVERRKDTTLRHDNASHTTNQRQDHTKALESFHEDDDMDEMSFRAEKQQSSRKPLILRVPQNGNFSSLSDIMRRLQPQQSSSRQQTIGSKMALSELSRSMMDLSTHNTDSTQDRGTAVPRLQANFFDPGRITPAITLMRKRNDELKSGLYRTPNLYQPSARPRSAQFGLQMDWRSPPSDREPDTKY